MFGVIGVPVPDELLLAYVGYLVSKGQLHYFWAVMAGALGSLTGMSVSFFAGYKLGKPFVEKWGRKIHLTSERVDRVEQWFERFGSWTVTLGYFIPGFRHLTAITAGVSRWNYGSFSMYALAGAILWVFFFISTGVYFGEHWSHYLIRFHHWIKWGAPVILLIILVIGIIRFRQAKK
jgi:membrane protein DedA with SNARE-associated domain